MFYIYLAKKPCERNLCNRCHVRCLGRHENMANVDPGNAYLLGISPHNATPRGGIRQTLHLPSDQLRIQWSRPFFLNLSVNLSLGFLGLPKEWFESPKPRRKFRYKKKSPSKLGASPNDASAIVRGISTSQNAKVNWGRFVWDFFWGEVSSSEKSSRWFIGVIRAWMVQWLKGLLGFYSKDNVCYFQENCSEWQMLY